MFDIWLLNGQGMILFNKWVKVQGKDDLNFVQHQVWTLSKSRQLGQLFYSLSTILGSILLAAWTINNL